MHSSLKKPDAGAGPAFQGFHLPQEKDFHDGCRKRFIPKNV
jgi:hypothetical protein